MDRPSARTWLDLYATAWEQADADAVTELFTDSASYRSHIFRAPHLGRDAIRAYWERATSTQSDISVRFGLPLVDQDRVAAEWWTTFRDDDDGEVTLPGCLILRFAKDGRCEDLREYWHFAPGRQEPHDGWGSLREGGSPEASLHAVRWSENYAGAWKAGNADAVALLYTEDAVYRSHPFRPPSVGRDGVLAYTKEAFASEESPAPRFGRPIAQGSSAVIEYWTTLRENGEEATLAGCDVLQFSEDGLVVEAREYWHLEPGTHESPESWGT